MDDWLSNGLPSFSGDKDKTSARKMLDHLGGPSGFKTDYRTNADGSVTTIQLKGTMPPQITTTIKGGTNVLMFGNTLVTWAEATDLLPVVNIEPVLKLKPRVISDTAVQHLSSDGVLELWQMKSDVDKSEKALGLCVRDNRAVARAPSAAAKGARVWKTDYSKQPDGKYVFGNSSHGRVRAAGYVEIAPGGYTVPALTSWGVTIPSPDSALIEFAGMPDPVNSAEGIDSGKELRKRAIVFTQRRVYDARNGNQLGVNTHLYRAPDGTGYLVKCEVMRNGTPSDGFVVGPFTTQAVTFRVTVTPTKPSSSTQTPVTVWTSPTFTQGSVSSFKLIDILTNFSADGTKVVVSMRNTSDVPYSSFNLRNDHRTGLNTSNGGNDDSSWGVASARYEIVLTGGLSPTTAAPNPPAVSATATLIPGQSSAGPVVLSAPILSTYYKNTLIVFRVETTYAGVDVMGTPAGDAVSARLLRNTTPVAVDLVIDTLFSVIDGISYPHTYSHYNVFTPASNNVVIWTLKNTNNSNVPSSARQRTAILPIDVDGLDAAPPAVNANGVVTLGLDEGVWQRWTNFWVNWVSWNPVTNEILTSNSVATDDHWV